MLCSMCQHGTTDTVTCRHCGVTNCRHIRGCECSFSDDGKRLAVGDKVFVITREFPKVVVEVKEIAELYAGRKIRYTEFKDGEYEGMRLGINRVFKDGNKCNDVVNTLTKEN